MLDIELHPLVGADGGSYSWWSIQYMLLLKIPEHTYEGYCYSSHSLVFISFCVQFDLNRKCGEILSTYEDTIVRRFLILRDAGKDYFKLMSRENATPHKKPPSSCTLLQTISWICIVVCENIFSR
jgi:hypothetical protein